MPLQPGQVYLDPRIDAAFKKVFNLEHHQNLIIHLLNALLRRKEGDRIVKVEPLPIEMIPDIEENKKSILDLRCTDERKIQYIVEIQNKNITNFIQRCQFYASQNYGRSLKMSEDYISLRPLIMISILNQNIFPPKVNYISYHNTVEEETQECFLQDIAYVFVELKKFKNKDTSTFNIIDWWMDLFKHATEHKAVPEGAPLELDEAYEALNRMGWTEAELATYERDQIYRMDEANSLRTSREEGLKEGLEKGAQEKSIEIAKQMIIDGLPTATICKYTSLTEEEILTLQASISK